MRGLDGGVGPTAYELLLARSQHTSAAGAGLTAKSHNPAQYPATGAPDLASMAACSERRLVGAGEGLAARDKIEMQ